VLRRGSRELWRDTRFLGKDRLRERDGNLVYLIGRIDLDVACAALAGAASEAATPSSGRQNGAEASAGFLSSLQYYLLAFLSSPGAPGDPPFVITRTQTTRLPVQRVPVASDPRRLGDIRFRGRTAGFSAPGFRYAPARSTAEAQAVNASATALAYEGEVATHTALRWLPDNTAHVIVPVAGWMFGVTSNLRLSQDGLGVVDGEGEAFSGDYWSFESSTTVSAARRVSPELSLGAAATLHVLTAEQPDHVAVHTDYGYAVGDPTMTEVVVSRSKDLVRRWRTATAPDLDLSATWDVRPELRLGAAILGVFDRHTYAENSAPDGRTIGAGASAFLGRWNFGADVERSRTTGWNGSLGASVIVADHVELVAGALSRGTTLRLGLRLRSLAVTWSLGADGQELALGARFKFL
jgi:hypothetical protein